LPGAAPTWSWPTCQGIPGATTASTARSPRRHDSQAEKDFPPSAKSVGRYALVSVHQRKFKKSSRRREPITLPSCVILPSPIRSQDPAKPLSQARLSRQFLQVWPVRLSRTDTLPSGGHRHESRGRAAAHEPARAGPGASRPGGHPRHQGRPGASQRPKARRPRPRRGDLVVL
jgi:hypothetical protein